MARFPNRRVRGRFPIITPMSDPRHLMRFLEVESGLDEATVAKTNGVTVATIRDSVNAVRSYRQQNSTIQMDLAIRHMVISTVPKAAETLKGLLGATELVEVVNPKTGRKRVVEREDKTTRIEAVRLVNQAIQNTTPKGPPIEVNVNQTTQVANLSSAETTEERFRRLKIKANEFNALPPEVSAVPDHIDSGEELEDGEDEDEDD